MGDVRLSAGERAMMLDGLGRRHVWPAAPGAYTEDDFVVEPAAGLAAVARGCGAIGGQGKPAGKLAVWSLAGEVSAPAPWPGPGTSAEVRIQCGFARADAAVGRLSASWPQGLAAPFASMAAVLLDGASAVVAHVGDCRAWRFGANGVEALTRDHTIGAEWPDERVPAHAAGVITRAIGRGGEPAIQRVPAQVGDLFLLTTHDVHRALSEAELASALRRLAANSEDALAVISDLMRVIEGQRPYGGRATLVIASVVDVAAQPASRGCSAPPRLGWMFAPGAPLDEAPRSWGPDATSAGPDARWFSEVFAGVMGDDG